MSKENFRTKIYVMNYFKIVGIMCRQQKNESELNNTDDKFSLRSYFIVWQTVIIFR